MSALRARIDLHRRRSQIAVVDEHGSLTASRPIVTDRRDIPRSCSAIRATARRISRCRRHVRWPGLALQCCYPRVTVLLLVVATGLLRAKRQPARALRGAVLPAVEEPLDQPPYHDGHREVVLRAPLLQPAMRILG